MPDIEHIASEIFSIIKLFIFSFYTYQIRRDEFPEGIKREINNSL